MFKNYSNANKMHGFFISIDNKFIISIDNNMLIDNNKIIIQIIWFSFECDFIFWNKSKIEHFI